MDATCKTCKWWGRVYRGCCDLVGVDGDLVGVDGFEIIATAADDHNLTALLATGPDFGCVHHAPKEAEGRRTS
jgi:hypothetical protein